jgi:hypothetical protein
MEKLIERINGARVITVVFYKEKQNNGNLGYIDYVDSRWGKPRHRFAFIDSSDFEREISQADNAKAIESQVITLQVLLEQALRNDKSVDMVVERRQMTSVQQFDFLVQVDNIAAFQG